MMRLAAALGLGLVLAVVIAAAGIRLGIGVAWLRPVHRVAASLEVVVLLWIVWMAWRRPAVWVAVALTAVLSAVGIVGGQEPGRALATVNLLGGLALAATFAWLLGSEENRGQSPIFWLVGLQVCLGAALAIFDAPVVPLHAMLAVALTALLVWLSWGRPWLVVLALAAPLAGFSLLHYDGSALAALAHAITAALLVCAAAIPRRAPSSDRR
jgi:hypothetical protein